MVIAHKMANVGYSRCKNGEKWQKMVSKHAPIRAPNDRLSIDLRSTNIVPYDLRYTVGLYVGIHSKYFKPQLVSKMFSAHFDPNQCRSVNFTTLSFMNDGNISQIWTHIFKGGLLVVDGCAYFNQMAPSSTPNNAQQKIILVTIMVTILAWTMAK